MESSGQNKLTKEKKIHRYREHTDSSQGRGTGGLGEKGERIKQQQKQTKNNQLSDTEDSLVITIGKGAGDWEVVVEGKEG